MKKIDFMTTPATVAKSQNHSLRKRQFRHISGAAIIALTALCTPLVLTGCGGGGGKTGTSPTNRSAKGSVSFNIAWPERTRLIPQAANSIVVTLTRNADTLSSSTVTYRRTINRPFSAPAANAAKTPAIVTSASFDSIEVGTYDLTVASYAEANASGTATPDPATGANVPLSIKIANDGIVVQDGQTTAMNFILDTTVQTVQILLPNDFAATPANAATNAESATAVNRIRPGQKVQLTASGFDATPATATPAGPYRVLLGKVSYNAVPGGVVSIDANGLLTANIPAAGTPESLVERTATITVTDQETGKVSAPLVVRVTPVGLSSNALWSKFHGNQQNTGVSASTVIPTGADPVVFPTGSLFQFASPVVGADGTIYIGTFSTGNSGNDQKLFALNPDNTRKWTFDAQGDVDTAPVIGADGTIFFTTTNGKVYAIRDTAQGPRVRWTVDLPTRTGRDITTYASPTLDSNGALYIATAAPDNRLYAIDSLTGAPIQSKDEPASTARDWVFVATSDLVSAPTISSDQQFIYTADIDGNVYRIRTGFRPASPGALYDNQALLSDTVSYSQYGPVLVSPVLSEDPANPTLFVATTGNNIIALNPATLRLKTLANNTNYVIDTGAPVYSTPALSPDRTLLYYATQDFSSDKADDKIAALNTTTGAEVWRTTSATSNGSTATSRFPGGFNASPVIVSSGGQLYLYIAGYNGSIYGFNASATGATVREPILSKDVTLSAFLGSPAIGQNGSIIIGGGDGRVYLVR